MHCSRCGATRTRVIDSRHTDEGSTVRRRRSCPDCGHRFTTYERAAAAPTVRKRDGTSQAFNGGKIRAGLERAMADRPLPPKTVEGLINRVEESASRQGEISSDWIGQQVLAELRRLDEVAYLRFASVYKGFEGPSDFEAEMAALDD